MDTINDFLGNRRKGYRWILNEYFRETKQDPDTYFKNKKKHDYKKDITTWWNNHLDEVPKTRNTKLSVMHTFFDHYEIVYPKAFWLGLRKMKKGTRAATLDRTPTANEFRNMLMHGNILDKAFFLLLSSSGMRPKEALQLTPQMINLQKEPGEIKLPGTITKTGDPRLTFITSEAKGYLKEWLKIRERYIDTAIRKTKGLCKKQREDNRIFPFCYDVCWTRWNNMLRKTGLDERDMTTNRYVLHLYSLRKFFLSQMKLEVPVVIPEALAGHEEGLDESYRRFTPDEVAEYYRKAEPRLTILSAPADLSGLHDDITKLKEENRNTTDMLSKLMVNYNLLKDEYEKIKNKK